MINRLFNITILLAVLALTAVSCNDEVVGSSLTDTQSVLEADSSFTLTGLSLLNTHVQSRSSRETDDSDARLIMQLLGELKCNGYGTLKADVVTQFMPTALVDTVNTSVDAIDSCRLALRIPTQGFTGDSLVPMRLNVYRLSKQLPDPIYSDFDVNGYYNESDLLGSVSYSANALMKGTATNSLSYRTVYVPMPLQLAREIYLKFKADPEIFKNPNDFVNFFPGVYIKNSFGSGRVMNFFDAELEMWYKKTMKDEQGKVTGDTVLQQTLLSATPEVISNSNISLTPDPKIQAMVDGGDAVILAPACYEVNVRFPLSEIIAKYNLELRGHLGVVNAMSLSIPAETIENDCGIAPPKHLLLVRTSHKDDFIAGDSIPDNRTSFYATYNASTKSYDFSGMRNYALDIIKYHDGEVTDDDMQLTIMPVDINFYAPTSIYGTVETTTVTKVSPGISVPAAVRLLHDKAKVKIVFTRQMM